MNWPHDADGDVFRSLEQQGFDFHQIYIVDFNVDFDRDDFASRAILAISETYPQATILDSTKENPPYLQVQMQSRLNYEFVVATQSKLSKVTEPFGGWCESWGVLH